MLSTNTTSSIQRRRTQHRRQNSTPAAFEAPTVRPLPANIRQQRQQRSGMSPDLRLNISKRDMSGYASLQDQMNTAPINVESYQPEDSTVSNTNIGQPQQHYMQVAQPHSHAQPGLQEPFMQSPVQQSLPSPRTPHRTLRGQSPPQLPSSPSKPAPSERQLKELHEHIQSVYGNCGQVFINILPTPTPTPQKPSRLPSHEALDTAPMPPNFSGMTDINFEPTSSAMTFDFDNPDADMGYESSSYYTSDAVSPSPLSSPQQRSVQMVLPNIEEHPEQEMAFPTFPEASTLLPSANTTNVMHSEPLLEDSMPGASLLTDLEVDASLEYTGISPEDVQRYISEQDPTTNKWTCLYPACQKMFGRRENIRSHVQTHLGDRQFRCNGCGKCFVRQHDLKRHAKIHSGNKPYKCPCGAGFARQDALTRHRQRGMCVGGFPDAVRRQAKRGRPKKNRPDIDERMDKANKTRRALASAASSVSAGSPASDAYSASNSPQSHDQYDAAGLQNLLPEMGSFSDPMSSSSAYGFEPASSPFDNNADIACPSSFASDASLDNLITQLSHAAQSAHTTQTPPMSPAGYRPYSSSSANDSEPLVPSSLQKGSSTPSHASIQSNPFSTPPTSPAQPKDELDELFNTLTEGACSQFDLEMKAMGEFTSLDNTAYDFLNFEV